MSNAVFPTLPGVAFNVQKSPVWATQVQRSASGREYALGKRQYPTWHFRLPFEVLRKGGTWQEWETLVGFINARKGRYDDFLYQDPRDCTVTNQQFGVGDGVTKTFQLVRAVGGFTEPVGGIDIGPSRHIYVGGVDTAGVTFDATQSYVTFAVAPANGAVLTWTGTFYYRVRFKQDEISFEEFLANLFSAKSVEFESFRV